MPPDIPPPPARPTAVPVIDAVAIGRNEGARLLACLASLRGQVRRIVYVDSGSTDGSAAAARAAGAEVVDLDMSQPFSAARARNAGLQALAADPPDAVQMIDGDCALADGWLEAARTCLEADPGVAVVCGRRRERLPEASLYNRLCDWEWDTPVGPARACGGDALIRFAPLIAAGGYRAEVIAAEDDEMCQRLRAAGWRVHRIAAEMTLHDAAIHRLGQFWRRAVRAGHGFAQVGGLHPGYFAAERRRALIWGGVLPALALATLLSQVPGSVRAAVLLALAGLYGLSFARVALRFRRLGMAPGRAAQASGLLMLSKFANLQGMALWLWRRWRGQATAIIEYK